MKKLILIVIHTLLQLLAFTSWLWLDYRIIVVLAGLHLIMLEFLKGCPLSQAQFPDNNDKRFYEWWLERFGIKLIDNKRRKVRFFMQYILPIILVLLAVLVQVGANLKPIISL